MARHSWWPGKALLPACWGPAVAAAHVGSEVGGLSLWWGLSPAHGFSKGTLTFSSSNQNPSNHQSEPRKFPHPVCQEQSHHPKLPSQGRLEPGKVSICNAQSNYCYASRNPQIGGSNRNHRKLNSPINTA